MVLRLNDACMGDPRISHCISKSLKYFIKNEFLERMHLLSTDCGLGIDCGRYQGKQEEYHFSGSY